MESKEIHPFARQLREAWERKLREEEEARERRRIRTDKIGGYVMAVALIAPIVVIAVALLT